jgi:hypothetical protein
MAVEVYGFKQTSSSLAPAGGAAEAARRDVRLHARRHLPLPSRGGR